MRGLATALACATALLAGCANTVRGTGDLGVVVERAAGRLQIVETTGMTRLATVDGLGDLSHASVVFSRDARYAYVFGRDGGLTKVDLLAARIERRVIQSGNAIGGAISQDGSLVVAANHKPGGIRIFDARTLERLSEVPTGAKVVGIADAPGNRFAFSLFDIGGGAAIATISFVILSVAVFFYFRIFPLEDD